MDKFGRNYILQVQSNSNLNEVVVIRPPFTLEFDIDRKELSSSNICSLRIYNLNERTRNQILKDQYIQNQPKQVILEAGYGDGPNFPVIFIGEITRAFSVREGNNFITQIECFDGGNTYQNAIIDQQFVAGTPYQTIIETLIDSLKQSGVQRGLIGSYPGVTGRGYAANGRTIDILTALTAGGFYIDNNKAYALGLNEGYINNEVSVINSASGLLGTPRREERVLLIPILFEPKLSIGQLVKLESVTGANFNAQYKVAAVHHKGMISDAVCGEAVTNVTVYYNEALTPVIQ